MNAELPSAGPKFEINVTPLIDVLLVLLIIFMVITPLTSSGLPAAIPETAPAALPQPMETPIVLQVMEDHTLRLNRHPIDAGSLRSVIGQVFSARAKKVLFIEADEHLEYREVAQLIDLVRGWNPSIEIGFTKSDS
jgi:biopolymer transport protein ExbD